MIVFKPSCGSDIAAFFFEVVAIRDELATRLDDAFRASPATSIWFVPNAQPEDRIKAQAPADWGPHPFIAGEFRQTAINLAETAIFHAPTVGTYSVWMIPGVKHAEFEPPGEMQL